MSSTPLLRKESIQVFVDAFLAALDIVGLNILDKIISRVKV